MTILTFILRRAAYQWPRLLTLSLGVLLATTLLAASPALTATIIDYSLRRGLENGSALESNLRLTSRLDLADQQIAAVDAEQRQDIDSRLGGYVKNVVIGGSMIPFTPWRDGVLLNDERIILRFYDSAENLRAQIEILEGEWPDQWAVSTDYIPVLISPNLAAAYELTIGSELPLSSSRDVEAPTLNATVVGIIQPKDGQNDYWFGSLSPFSRSADGRFNAEYSLLMPPDALLKVAQIHFPERDLSLHWNILLATNRLTQSDIDPLIQTVKLWREDARGEPGLTLFSELDETLEQFKATIAFVRSPLFFIILIVALLALFYIVLVNALSLAQTQGEFAVLISRGADRRQIVRWQGIETLGLVLFAVLLGPLLAWIGVQTLSRFGPLGAVRSADWVISFPRLVWLTAFGGALAAAISSFLPLPATLRSSVVTHLQRRVRQQETMPWWQRYYADVMLLIIGGILVSRLPLYGSILGDTESDGVDWLLLLAPAFILFGTATIFLRVFPPLLQLAARVASRYRGLSLVLVLWQVARQPRHVSRLLLLLTITTALGLFSTSLDATLARNETARARFVSVGAQRLSNPDLDQVVSAEGSTLFWRSNGAIGASLGDGGERFELLAVDPETFNTVADYRADFASEPVANLLTALESDLSDTFRTPPLLELPDQPRQIELYFWMRDEDADFVSGFSFDAKLFLATDEVITVKMLPSGERDEKGWTRFSAAVPQLNRDQYPLKLMSIWMRSANVIFIFPDAAPAIDQISVMDDAGRATTLAGFEIGEDFRWQRAGGPIWPVVENRNELQGLLGDEEEENEAIKNQFPFEGDNVLAMPLFFESLTVGFPYGIHTWTRALEEPVPVLVTPKFIEASGSEVGDVVIARMSSGSATSVPVSLKISAVVNYFPTLEDGEKGGSVITLRDPILRYVNTFDLKLATSNEIAFLEPTADVTLLNSASDSWDFDQIQAALKATPLVLGLRTVTVFGYILSAVLSLAGFATYFFLNTQQLSGSYAILRALGMSVRQLYATLLIEQAILVVCGLGLGTGLGLLLSRTTLQNLAFRTGDIVALPPFELVVDWTTVATVLLTLTFAFAVTLSLVTLSLWRTDIHRVLRVGEE
ncbi:MAG: FtsX-like permease family protein [Anaerolineae bacterium]